MDLKRFEALFENKISQIASSQDPAHDLLHFQRVVKMAKKLCVQENGKLEVVVPAAWLHDFVNVPKNDPRRSRASRLSAEAAVEFLRDIEYPTQHFNEIAHAIAAHSFSANIPCETLEAAIVQDADRLDSLGAIGVARTFATGALMQRPFYSGEDPFYETRVPDDRAFTLDHFPIKLLKLAETMKTKSGKAEAVERVNAMKEFLAHLRAELE